MGWAFVVAVCLCVQTWDLICFVWHSFSSLWWVLVWIWENPLCLHQRLVEWLWCMPVSPPAIINSNEDVPTHSSFPLRECWFPWVKGMPITLTSFTLSSSLPTPASSPTPPWSPDFFPLYCPLELCSGKSSGTCRNISYFHFHVQRQIYWTRVAIMTGGRQQKSTMPFASAHYLGSVSQVSIELDDGKVAQCTLGMDGSLGDGKEAIRLRTTLSLCRIWSRVDRVY